MCYCNPSIRTSQCPSCIYYLAQKVESLEALNKNLFDALRQATNLKCTPPPMIFCKECPNIDIDLIEKRLDAIEDNWSRRHEP